MNWIIGYIGIFFLMQAIAQVCFKWGSSTPQLWWYGFILGNAFGASSIIFMMNLYKMLNPNMVLVIGIGGSFVLNNIAIALLFKSQLNLLQWVAITIIVLGIALFSLAQSQPIQ